MTTGRVLRVRSLRSVRRARRETAAERAFANRWYTLAEAYEVLTALALPPELERPAPSRRRRGHARGAAHRRDGPGDDGPGQRST